MCSHVSAFMLCLRMIDNMNQKLLSDKVAEIQTNQLVSSDNPGIYAARENDENCRF